MGRKRTNGEEKEVKRLLQKCGDIIRKFYCALNLPELERDSEGDRRSQAVTKLEYALRHSCEGFRKYAA